MSLPFQNKVVLITGAGSGIGRATAIKLSHQGATLALTDINASSLAETLTLCTPGSHITSSFDIASSTLCNAFIESTISVHKSIHHIFNCAGRNPVTTFIPDITDEYWDSIMNTNMKGIFNITRAVIPFLEKGASFVNVSSVAGLQPMLGFASYCASKYAVVGFSKCVALELGPKGIRCNVVAPGYIHTPSNFGVVTGEEAVQKMAEATAMGRVGTADEVADVVIFLFSDEARYVNGSVVEINGGLK